MLPFKTKNPTQMNVGKNNRNRSEGFSLKRHTMRGVALAETAIALILLMLLGIVFWETVMLTVSHQRATYASYVGERARIVGGDAVAAATEVGGRMVDVGGSSTTVWEQLSLPLGLVFEWDSGNSRGVGEKNFRVSRTVQMPEEPEDIGDNAYKPHFAAGGVMEHPELPVPIGGYVALPGGEGSADGNPDAGGGGNDDGGDGGGGGDDDAGGGDDDGGDDDGGGDDEEENGGGDGGDDDEEENGGECGECSTSEAAAQTSPGASSCAGNPIDVTNGNKYQREVDIRYSADVYAGWNDQGSLPQSTGRSYSNALPILFSRHYNSIYERVGVLGGGWRHGYEVELQVKSNRRPVEQQPYLRLQQADGRKIDFERTEIIDGKLIYRAESRDDGWLVADSAHYRWYWHDGRELLFNDLGRLLRISVPNGDTQTLYYDRDGRVTSIRDSYGREFNLSYNAKGQLNQIKAIDGETVSYRYSEQSQLLEVEYADKTSKVYHYEDQRDHYNLTGITDARGIRYASWGYDDKDRAIMSTHAEGVGKVTVEYLPNKQTKVTNSLGESSIYHWERMGLNRLVTKVQGPGCSSCGAGDVEYKYSEYQQMVKKSTREGIKHSYAYDELGRRTEVKQHSRDDTERLIANYSYRPQEQLRFSPLDTLPTKTKRPSVKTGDFHRTEFEYTEDGQLRELKELGFRPQLADNAKLDQVSYHPIERITKYDYNQRGQLIQIDGPREDVNDITRFKYYPVQQKGVLDKGRLHQVIDANNDITYQVNVYDKAGRVLEDQRNRLIPTQYQYDKRGRITQTRRGEQISKSEYNKAGNMIKRINPDGTTSQYEYDEANRSIKSTAHNGEMSIRQLDTENNLLNTQLLSKDGEVLRQSSSVYDDYDRRIEVKDADGIVIQRSIYNANDLVVESIDGNGNATQYSYDQWNRKIKTIRADNTTITNSYDEQNRLISVVDPRQNETRYHIDDYGLRIAQLSADTGLSQYQYDNAGNLINKTSASGLSIEYEYDQLNRKTKKIQPEGSTAYQYDEHNQLIEVNGIHNTETYGYDEYGRKVNHTREIEQHQFSTRYAYNDKTGQLTTKILPDGQALEYIYYISGKNLGELRSMILDQGNKKQTLIEDMDYSNINRRSYMLGNGIEVIQRYNQKGQLMHLNYDGVLNLNYAYDVIGNITEINRNDETEQYGYDSVYQLTEAKMKSGDFAYSYDEVGNRVEYSENNILTEYQYSDASQGNYLLTAGDESYQYNAEGSPTQIGDQRLTYDSEQRLIEYSNSETNLTANYKYNHQGERITKQIDAKTTYYLYEEGKLSASFTQQDQNWEQYIYHNSDPVVQLENQDIIYIHNDHLGTPQVATGKSQQIIWQNDPQPFGNKDNGQERIKLRFPGQYYDGERGTYYNYYRDYDPNIGRYQTSDPIGLRGGVSTYRYVFSSPINFTDPYGLKTYRCKRPLGFMGDVQFGDVSHSYLCVVDQNGATVCGGQTIEGGGIDGPGAPTSPGVDYYDPSRCKEIYEDNACLENCLKYEFNQPRPHYNLVGVGGQNCHEWASNIFNKCKAQCNVTLPPSPGGRPGPSPGGRPGIGG